jgi:hypothetical protein
LLIGQDEVEGFLLQGFEREPSGIPAGDFPYWLSAAAGPDLRCNQDNHLSRQVDLKARLLPHL